MKYILVLSSVCCGLLLDTAMWEAGKHATAWWMATLVLTVLTTVLCCVSAELRPR